MTIKEAFDKFIRHCKRKGLSDKSILNYIEFINPFLVHMGNDTELETIKEEDINTYIDTLYSRIISKATRATYIRNMKVFLNYVKKYEGVDLYTSRIIVPKANKKILRIYEDDDIRLIFQTIHAENDWLTARNLSLIHI